jgi:hypothetical protein
MEMVVKTVKSEILGIIIVGFITTPLFAQNPKNMSLSLDPIMLAGGSIPLTFQAKVSERLSLSISGYDKVYSFTKTKLLGVGGGLGAKFHLSAPGFEDGWYIRPEAMLGLWTIGDMPNRSQALSLEPRLMAGYDWIWHNGLSVGLGLGIKYVYFGGNPASVQDFSNFGFHDFFPNADISVGWAF